MNSDTAQQFLKNLFERASVTREQTFLTSLEIKALSVVLTGLQGQNNSERQLPTADDTLIGLPNIALDAIATDMVMCIDFGTSFSKAFACLDTKHPIPEIIDLPVGEYGKSEQPLLTPSEILIDEKVIYFGGVSQKTL